MSVTTLKKIENEYKSKVRDFLDNGGILNADALIDLSITLFHELKVKETDPEDPESDMLLFQYGTYNWGEPLGEHFNFDITRQFISKKNDEPYQLSFSFIFDPQGFEDCGRYNCWSCDFPGLDEWVKHIRATKGYELARKQNYKLYQVKYDEI